jgi:hypothetical protein
VFSEALELGKIYSSLAMFALFARGAIYFLSSRNPAVSLHKMLYLIGLGLSDETDITVKGLEIVHKASRVYLEAYTSILLVEKSILVCISNSRKEGADADVQ